jgi:hypothetical protein
MLNENRFLGTFRGHNTRTIGLEPGLDSGLEPKMTSSDFDG